MPITQLINDMRIYCATKFPSIKDIKAISLSLNENQVVLGSKTKLEINGRINFDYIAGTPYSDYDHIFKKAYV